jgi:hypothetical protein
VPWRQLIARTNMLLPGLYAWVSTVASPVAARGAPSLARFTAIAALIALVTGPLLALERPRAGRAVGVYAFVALSLATWLLGDALVGVQRLEPVRAALGAVGWALFAFGWGTARTVGDVPEEDPHAISGAPLAARSQLPKGTLIVFGIGLAGALLPVLLAWRVERPGHALLAHAAALACAIAIVTAAAKIAIARGSWQPVTPPRARLVAATRPLALVSVLLAGGMLWALLR